MLILSHDGGPKDHTGDEHRVQNNLSSPLRGKARYLSLFHHQHQKHLITSYNHDRLLYALESPSEKPSAVRN